MSIIPLLRRIQIHQRLAPIIILQYDPPSRDLRVWFWYVLTQSYELRLIWSQGLSADQEHVFLHLT